MARIDGRAPGDLRPIKFTPDFLSHPQGSVLVEFGKTRVICAASVVPGVPRWMREQNVPGGWLTGEYAMLPSATADRKPREISNLRPDGRSQEIQRLIGRSLRSVVNLRAIGQNTIYVDCDVIDADGGTRCASICGAVVALNLAFRRMFMAGEIGEMPMKQLVAAVSVGMHEGEPLLDLCYEEDSAAAVDMNVVMTENAEIVEVQGSGEEATFKRAEMDRMLELADKGIKRIVEMQRKVLKQPR